MTTTTEPKAVRIIGLLASNLCMKPEDFRAVEKDGWILILTSNQKDQGRIIGNRGVNINALRGVADDLGVEITLIEPIHRSQLTGEAYEARHPCDIIKEVLELRSEKTGVLWTVQPMESEDEILLEIECQELPSAITRASYELLFRSMLRKYWAPLKPDYEVHIEWAE